MIEMKIVSPLRGVMGRTRNELSDLTVGTSVYVECTEPDIDGELYVYLTDDQTSASAYVLADCLVQVPAATAKVTVVEETKTIVEKVFVLRLTEAEAEELAEVLGNTSEDAHPGLDALFDALSDLLDA